MYRYRNSTYLKDIEMDLKLTEYKNFFAKRVYLLSYIDNFYKRCIVLDEKKFIFNTNSVKTGCFFPNEHFSIVPGIKKDLWTQ